jgi:NAD(P)-dependent dehydrogenase (short-subunit alcohol dehydrogenase family)
LSSKPAIWTSFHVEKLDIDDTESIAALGDRLSGRRLDMLFINAGTTTREQDIPVGLVTTSEFNRVMLTNALGPMRVIEALEGYVPADGMIGAMSSGQGSIANNDRGLREVYRASKAALNMSMRSFAASQRGGERALLLLALGWIRTDLGGSDAPIRWRRACRCWSTSCWLNGSAPVSNISIASARLCLGEKDP